jgi:hypothetical protein
VGIVYCSNLQRRKVEAFTQHASTEVYLRETFNVGLGVLASS